MQKFEKSDEPLSNRRNIIVMADEAHRGQYGLSEKVEITNYKDNGENELAFYDALTKPQAIKDFFENDELLSLTKELTELLRKNRSIDWQKKETARAGMRKLVKRLLKKHRYPPEGMDDAVQTVMSQCVLWTDKVMEV